MDYQALCINEKDNVAVALEYLRAGQRIVVKVGDKIEDIMVVDDIPPYHKFALKDVRAGEKIYKYGEIIGKAIEDIKTGGYVHTHNIESLRG